MKNDPKNETQNRPAMERLGAYLLVWTLGLPIYLIGLAIGFALAMLSKNKDTAQG